MDWLHGLFLPLDAPLWYISVEVLCEHKAIRAIGTAGPQSSCDSSGKVSVVEMRRMKWTFGFSVLRAVDISVLVRSKALGVVSIEEASMNHPARAPKEMIVGLVLSLDLVSPLSISGCHVKIRDVLGHKDIFFNKLFYFIWQKMLCVYP